MMVMETITETTDIKAEEEEVEQEEVKKRVVVVITRKKDFLIEMKPIIKEVVIVITVVTVDEDMVVEIDTEKDLVNGITDDDVIDRENVEIVHANAITEVEDERIGITVEHVILVHHDVPEEAEALLHVVVMK